MPDPSYSREIAALDAIIAYGLAGQNVEDLSDSEILALLSNCEELSAQGEQAILDLGHSPFSSRPQKPQSSSSFLAESAAVFGMYRAGSDEGIQPELKAEIDRKREEIRARLKKNPG